MWVRGRGWNQDFFEDEKRFLTKEDLDQVSSDHPICLERACGHICVANSKALEMLNITKRTKVPNGGEVNLSDKGEITGIFKEKAMSMIMDQFPKPNLNKIKKILIDGFRELNSYGVTSAQSDDFVCIDAPFEYVIKAYDELIKEGIQTVRVYEQAHLKTPEQLKDFIAKGYKTGVGNNLFKIGPLKMFADGSLGARSALLREPYSDSVEDCGIEIYTQAELDEMVKIANENDMQIAIHAIGDKAIDMVVEAIEKALKAHKRKDPRHGIVHCQITDQNLWNKFEDLKLVAYVQSIFLDYDINIVRDRVGERAETSYAFKSLVDRGVNVCNGSDSPVELPHAMAGIQCAVTRNNLQNTKEPYLPQEALSVKEAIQSFTMAGAYASFEENIKGNLKEYWRYRLGDYRILADINDDEIKIIIFNVGHRREIYK